jgi:hypothetical protein
MRGRVAAAGVLALLACRCNLVLGIEELPVATSMPCGHACDACGHDCLGGACTGGLCQPVALAQNLWDPQDVALDGADLYFTTAGAGGLMRYSLTDQVTSTRWIDAASEPTRVAVGGGRVVWVTHTGFVRSLPREQAPGDQPRDHGGSQGPLGAVTVTDSNIYWVNGNAVMRADFAAAGPPDVLLGGLEPYEATATGVTFDEDTVFWAGGANGGGVFSVPSAGGAKSNLAVGQAFPGDLVRAGLDLFWLNGGAVSNSGAIVTVPISGGDAKTLAAGDDAPARLVVDATHVYWTVEGGGLIRRVRRDGTGVETIASGQARPHGLAVDENQVYWTNRGTVTGPDGSLMRLAK